MEQIILHKADNHDLNCEQMIRQQLKELDTFSDEDAFSVALVKEMLIECLRGF